MTAAPDAMLEAVREYRRQVAHYNAALGVQHDEQAADELAQATFGPIWVRLQAGVPVTTREGAIAALELAIEDPDDEGLLCGLVRSVIGFLADMCTEKNVDALERAKPGESGASEAV